ncbi:MAG TPA: GNAT family N-acetyltransferase [Kofleriaceae bacterium]|nr:GNAT family N-acetyltransferase [Kofleriaceae bacterium]
MASIREMDRVADRPGVAALDTSFETPSVFDVVVTPRRIDLVERTLVVPLVKRYPIEDVFADWATWEIGFVAEDEQICGFAAAEYEPWHARLVLWHLYVAPARRGEGIARALLAHVEQHGRELGARRVWLETSNVNVPGIAAYARLGYALCGADTTHYEATSTAAESAVFLSRPL